MSVTRRLVPAVAITGSSLLVGCGSGGGTCGSYGSYGCAPQGVDPSGIYQGTLINTVSQQQVPVVAIIAENGAALVSGSDGTYYRLNAGTTSNQLSGSYIAYSQSIDFPNGTLQSAGTLAATVTGTQIIGTFTDSSGQMQQLTLNLNSASNSGSALATPAGSWQYSNGGSTLNLTFADDGSFSGTDSNGCTYAGNLGLISAQMDAYSERYVRTCNGQNDTFSGLASYLPAGSGLPTAQLWFLADDDNGQFLSATFSLL
jgi:hypothetical protein